MRLKWPLVWRSFADQLERQIAFRDDLIDKLRAERDEACAELRRMVDNALMGIGQAPVSSEHTARIAQAEIDYAALNEALSNVDAESRLLNELTN